MNPLGEVCCDHFNTASREGGRPLPASCRAGVMSHLLIHTPPSPLPPLPHVAICWDDPLIDLPPPPEHEANTVINDINAFSRFSFLHTHTHTLQLGWMVVVDCSVLAPEGFYNVFLCFSFSVEITRHSSRDDVAPVFWAVLPWWAFPTSL